MIIALRSCRALRLCNSLCFSLSWALVDGCLPRRTCTWGAPSCSRTGWRALDPNAGGACWFSCRLSWWATQTARSSCSSPPPLLTSLQHAPPTSCSATTPAPSKYTAAMLMLLPPSRAGLSPSAHRPHFPGVLLRTDTGPLFPAMDTNRLAPDGSGNCAGPAAFPARRLHVGPLS